MSQHPLFRPAAINARQLKWLGEIVLVRPPSFFLLTTTASALALFVICFIVLGSYTKRTTVSGQLVPDLGEIKVYAPQQGIVLEKFIREGQRLKKGEIMYLTSSERQSNGQYGIQEAISRQVSLREQSLRRELGEQRKLQRDEEAGLRRKIAGIQKEHTNMVNQLSGQNARVQLAEQAALRTEQLRAQGFISSEMSQQKQADLLDQKNRYQVLERDNISVDRELQVLRDELQSLPLRQRIQSAQIERLIASTDQEWSESEGKRRIAILAPEGGIATGVTAEIGQSVDSSTRLSSILPHGAMLQAHLFAPSRAIGFIHTGDRVLLRFQAYPYQKFGHTMGIVASVSGVAMALNELTGFAMPANGIQEPLYRITVTIAVQTVTAYGKPQSLQAGMLIDADVLQDTRKLYEWVLEPLYSLTGKL